MMFIPASSHPDEIVDERQHFWISKPGLTPTEDLYVVKAVIPPGESHPFHFHPNKEEVIHVISGRAEQWVEEKMEIMEAGDSVYVPKSAVHATYNVGEVDLVFLAIITPGSAEGEMTVDVFENEPWKSLRK